MCSYLASREAYLHSVIGNALYSAGTVESREPILSTSTWKLVYTTHQENALATLSVLLSTCWNKANLINAEGDVSVFPPNFQFLENIQHLLRNDGIFTFFCGCHFTLPESLTAKS